MNPKVTVSLGEVVAACLMWSVAIALIEHFLFGLSGAEVFTRVYWVLAGAFGVYYAGWRTGGFV